MVLRTFNFWGFGGQYRKTIVFNDMFSKKSLKSMVLSTFNFGVFVASIGVSTTTLTLYPKHVAFH